MVLLFGVLLVVSVWLALFVGGVVGRDVRAGLEGRLAACRTNDCVVEALFAGLAEVGPREVLDIYRGTSPNSGGSIDCHDATHRLGERAFADLGVAAWVPGGNVCNFGYYHGLMVGASAGAEVGEFEALAHLLCEERALPETDLPGPECVHGFGHAVLHLSGSLREATSRCSAFGEGRYRRRCNEGVFKDGLMKRSFVTERDFQACDDVAAADRGTCVFVTAAYAVVRADDIGSVFEVCTRRPGGVLRGECEEGLGRGVSMRAVGERFREPGRWAVEVCGSSVSCAFGFGRSVYFIRNDEVWSLGQCAGFAAVLRARCEDGVRVAPGSL